MEALIGDHRQNAEQTLVPEVRRAPERAADKCRENNGNVVSPGGSAHPVARVKMCRLI